jgi:hypothetical protein
MAEQSVLAKQPDQEQDVDAELEAMFEVRLFQAAVIITSREV